MGTGGACIVYVRDRVMALLAETNAFLSQTPTWLLHSLAFFVSRRPTATTLMIAVRRCAENRAGIPMTLHILGDRQCRLRLNPEGPLGDFGRPSFDSRTLDPQNGILPRGASYAGPLV